MRLDLLIDFLAYDNTDPSNDPDDNIKIKKFVQYTDVDEVFRNFVRKIPDATVDLAVELPDADTDLLIILTDQTISIKLNGSATAQTLIPKVAGKKTLTYLQKGSVTALTISNASGTTAKVDIISANGLT